MTDAVVLFDGHVITYSDLTGQEYFNPTDPYVTFFEDHFEDDINRKGRVRRFKNWLGETYMAVFNSSDGKFRNYYREDLFWSGNVNHVTKTTTSFGALGIGFQFTVYIGNPELKIHMARKFLDTNANNRPALFIEVRTIETTNVITQLTFDDLPIPQTTPLELHELGIEIKDYINFVTNKGFVFYTSGIPEDELPITALEEYDSSVLNDVAVLLDDFKNNSAFVALCTQNEVWELFDNHIHVYNRFSDDFGTIESSYHKIYTQDYFHTIRLDLLEFNRWMQQFNGNYDNCDGDTLVLYCLKIFSIGELSLLSYAKKIKILNLIIDNNYFLFGNWGFNSLNEETLIIKLVKSFIRQDTLNVSEIRSFLDYLIAPYDGFSDSTRFEKLYDSIDDNQFFEDPGTGNCSQFVRIIYDMWLVTSYNIDNVIDLNATDPAIQDYALLYEDQPLILNYAPTKGSVYYNNNFDFIFRGTSIAVIEIIKEANEEVRHTIGTYGIYKTVLIKAVAPGSTSIGISDVVSTHGYVGIPLFLLKYVDDYDDFENLLTTAQIAFDIALTFTGIGNLTKLRHLRHLTKLGRLALGQAANQGEKILVMEALTGVAGVVELSSSLASIILHSYTDDCQIYIDGDNNAPSNTPEKKGINDLVNDENPNPEIPVQTQNSSYEFCKSLDRWFFWLQIASASVDLFASTMVRKTSRKLIDGGLPNDFDPDAYNVIMGFAGNTTEMRTVFGAKVNNALGENSQLLNDVDNPALFNMDQKYEFLQETKNLTPEQLLRFNDTTDSTYSLAFEWTQIMHLWKYRNSPEFLRCFRRADGNQELKTHIFLGEVKKGSAKGVHSTRQLNPNNPTFTVTPTGAPNSKGYYQATVTVKNPNNNLFYNKYGANKSIQPSTMYPDSWDETRIIEEISLALKNRKLVPGKDKEWFGIMSDGTKCHFYLHGNTTTIDAATTFNTAYPKI